MVVKYHGLLSGINNLIIQYWSGGSVPPITFTTTSVTFFDDYSSCHGGRYKQIPSGYGNGGAISIGY